MNDYILRAFSMNRPVANMQGFYCPPLLKERLKCFITYCEPHSTMAWFFNRIVGFFSYLLFGISSDYNMLVDQRKMYRHRTETELNLCVLNRVWETLNEIRQDMAHQPDDLLAKQELIEYVELEKLSIEELIKSNIDVLVRVESLLNIENEETSYNKLIQMHHYVNILSHQLEDVHYRQNILHDALSESECGMGIELPSSKTIKIVYSKLYIQQIVLTEACRVLQENIDSDVVIK